MKKIYFFSFCLLPLLVFAQSSSQKAIDDSVVYYQGQLHQLWRNAMDSVRQSQQFISLQSSVERLKGTSKHYSGLIMTYDVCHSDYKNFNRSLAQTGFDELNPFSFRFGLGISNKTNRTLLDIYFFIAGFNNTSKRNEASVKTSLSNFLQFDYGYAVVQSKRLSIYPFAGLSLRLSSLSYDDKVLVNTNYTNISNIIVNNQFTQTSSFRFGYQAGLGVDFLMSKPAQRSASFLFTKVGLNRPLGSDRYKIEDITYRPGIKQGDYIVSVGFKFTSRW